MSPAKYKVTFWADKLRVLQASSSALMRTGQTIIRDLLIDALLASQEGVLHKRADGHGTYAAGNRGDVAALGSYLVKLDIAAQTESALLGGIGHAGGAYVYDDGALLDHIGLYESGLSQSCYYDIGLEALLLDIGCVAVADGYGAVTGVGFLHQKAGHGLAYNVAAAQYDGLLAAGLDVVALEQLHDAVRCS